MVDRRSNPVGPDRATPADVAYNRQYLVIDLHADTLMWRRGLRYDSDGLGQVDLKRLVVGNIGLQVLTMPTRVPPPNTRRQCTDGRDFDPAPLLAFVNGWPSATWSSPYRRAVAQAEALHDAVAQSQQPQSPIRLHQIRTIGEF